MQIKLDPFTFPVYGLAATDAFQFLHTPEDRAIRRRMTIETDARYLKADRADAAVMRAKRVQS